MRKPSEAQMRAMQTAAGSPLVIDQTGKLVFDGQDGSRHQWAPVFLAIQRGWMRWVQIPRRNPEKVTLTKRGRELVDAAAAPHLTPIGVVSSLFVGGGE